MIKVNLNNKAFQIALARHNHTQNSFARELGISSGYLSQVVNHYKNLSPVLRRKMQDALGMSFDELFYIDEGVE